MKQKNKCVCITPISSISTEFNTHISEKKTKEIIQCFSLDIAAVADHGGSGFNTNMRNYNTKHGTNYLSGEFSHYAHGVDLLVRTGRNPKSWYGVGKNYLFVP